MFRGSQQYTWILVVPIFVFILVPFSWFLVSSREDHESEPNRPQGGGRRPGIHSPAAASATAQENPHGPARHRWYEHVIIWTQRYVYDTLNNRDGLSLTTPSAHKTGCMLSVSMFVVQITGPSSALQLVRPQQLKPSTGTLQTTFKY